MGGHKSHEMLYSLRNGWACAACPFAIEDTEAGARAAMGHVAAHQYSVQPPKPIDYDRPQRRQR